MTIDACVAHAISRDLDVLEALPQVQLYPVEWIDPLVAAFMDRVQERLSKAVVEHGVRYLQRHDAAGLCRALLNAQVGVLPAMLLEMCETMVSLYALEVRFLGDTPDFRPVFEVRMAMDVGPGQDVVSP
jgi:hypothetical protein